MPSVAVTVVGHDRPGIVHRVTSAIADLSGNLEDSSMSLLRGHFAMTLVAALPNGVPVSQLRHRLTDLADDGLVVSVFEVTDEQTPDVGLAAVVSVHGADRPGIVRAATAVIMDHGGNITDLSTRLGRDLYVLTADVSFPSDTELAVVAADLDRRMATMGVTASLHAVDEDLL